MCREMAEAWHIVKLDESVNAVVAPSGRRPGIQRRARRQVVIRAAGTTCGITRIRARRSAEWQKLWKPVVCAVQGMCTAGAFYFVNESDVVICSEDATFFDSQCQRRLGVRVGADRVDAPSRSWRDVANRVDGQRRTRRRGHRVAHWVGVGGGLPPDRLWARAHEIATVIAAKPPSATQGTVKAIWESLDKPYRAALEQNLIYTRLGNPLGQAELAAGGYGALAKPWVR